MPHITLEYSNNLPEPVDWAGILSELNATLMTLGLFRLEELKGRAIGYDQVVVGDGSRPTVFVHLTVAILTGREPVVRREISRVCLERLTARLAAIGRSRPLDITVDVREMDRQSYGKAATSPSP